MNGGRMSRCGFASLLIVALLPIAVGAQTPRRLRDMKVTPGTLIFIEGRDRRPVVARFVAVNGDVLIAQIGGVEQAIPAAAIRRLTGEGRDSLKNGALIGGAVGFGVGLAGCAGGGVDSGKCGDVGAAFGVGAITAGIGALIDSRRGRRVFYRAP
jgi:hypothetical protein